MLGCNDLPSRAWLPSHTAMLYGRLPWNGNAHRLCILFWITPHKAASVWSSGAIAPHSLKLTFFTGFESTQIWIDRQIERAELAKESEIQAWKENWRGHLCLWLLTEKWDLGRSTANKRGVYKNLEDVTYICLCWPQLWCGDKYSSWFQTPEFWLPFGSVFTSFWLDLIDEKKMMIYLALTVRQMKTLTKTGGEDVLLGWQGQSSPPQRRKRLTNFTFFSWV